MKPTPIYFVVWRTLFNAGRNASVVMFLCEDNFICQVLSCCLPHKICHQKKNRLRQRTTLFHATSPIKICVLNILSRSYVFESSSWGFVTQKMLNKLFKTCCCCLNFQDSYKYAVKSVPNDEP